MAFEFKKHQPVTKTVPRLGRKQIEGAVLSLESTDRLAAVHETRKTIKKLRALLRLVRDSMADSDYRQSQAILRKASGHLGTARDAFVKVNALRALSDYGQRKGSRCSFPQTMRLLLTDCRRNEGEVSRSHAPENVKRLLRDLAKDPSAFRLKGSGWSAISGGFRRSYRSGRRGLRLAEQFTTPMHLHEWRKRVKDLYYQIGLLRPIWPEWISEAETELEHLGDYLGDDHDLYLLVEPRKAKRLGKQAQREFETMHSLIAGRQLELRAKALVVGARFYEEKPSRFCKRLERRWKAWRGQ